MSDAELRDELRPRHVPSRALRAAFAVVFCRRATSDAGHVSPPASSAFGICLVMGLEPSPSDLKITAQIKAAGGIVGIVLLDHIIFNRVGYFSFLEEGRL